ncbi:protein arginine N-methyltransferase, putative [Pediculus humanus corporis]|uniref:type I protein arginine methyltransferase n=1 Tax=Pediculus humanus subsp. corporis TaxID=121224 RepID=E0VBG9_PEDHC|nr:protein arginine N-methyltransferase, putative [Pediculus humanus corporis]EEB10725.1 protein arginine N-methyltransferase, putative [Pediculus humanus corporis]
MATMDDKELCLYAGLIQNSEINTSTVKSSDFENESSDDDENDDTWNEMDNESNSFMSCLFCDQNFKTMAVALEHCKIEHKLNLPYLKQKFNMDCYSYICMINYVRRERISSEMLLSFKDPPWLNGEYLTPVIQDDPWLMFDFDDVEIPDEYVNQTPVQNYHVVNAENGLVTLTEQHFAQLQTKIKHLSLQLQEKEEVLNFAVNQIDKMKAVTQNLVSESSESEALNREKMKIKLVDDNGYFSSYSHFGIHLEMLSDKVRTLKYRNAILNNSSLIVNQQVLDIGCGTGILSMFAASAGAKKVYAIDQSEIIYSAMDIVRENDLLDKVHLLHGKIEEISLPVEKVDVIISEWMGYFLLYEGMLESVLIARDKYLKNGGCLLPDRCLLHLVGISDSDMYENLLGFWSDVYGFKMSCIVKEVIQEAHVLQVDKNSIATTSAVILDLDLYSATLDCIDFTSDFVLESTIDGKLTALCGYFDAIFGLPNSEILSTSPETDKTHWKQTLFFFKSPINVTKGSLINGKITCKRLAEDRRALSLTINLENQEKLEYFLM